MAEQHGCAVGIIILDVDDVPDAEIAEPRSTFEQERIIAHGLVLKFRQRGVPTGRKRPVDPKMESWFGRIG